MELIGREAELATLGELIAAVPEAGGTLVITGEAGIGKSSLLQFAVQEAAARGSEVLQAVGMEAEARLPYAGLHQILRPVLGGLGALATPHRTALQAAFGLEEGSSPEPFLIALAALNLLTEAALRRPILLAIDDVQWLDLPTQEALAFVARRLSRDAIVVVATLRKGHGGPLAVAGLPELEVNALDDTSSRQMLAAVAAELIVPDQERILRLARGNPLALVELPIAWRAADRAGAEGLATTLPLTARLERAFAGRVAELPAGTRDVMLIAAVDYGDELPEILAAASRLAGEPLGVEVFDSGTVRGLLVVDEVRVRFRHPLVRSAVLQGESLARKLAAHAALAQVLTGEPYRRTWHRAQSILGPDDEIADELEDSHLISLRRGSVTSAIWALERSAQLTTDSAKRGRRLLLAGEHAFGLGQVDLVDRLLKAAALTELSELDRARMEWIREIFNDGVPGDAVRVLELCDIAQRSHAAGDTDLALNLLLGAALRCWWANTGPEARDRVATVTASLHSSRDSARHLAALAVAEPIRLGTAVTAALPQMTAGIGSDADSLRLYGMAAHAVGDLVSAVDLLGRAEQPLREQGRLGLLSHVLTMQIGDHLWLGNWERAAALAAEGRRIAADTGQPIWTTGSLSLDAIATGLRGHTQRALEMAATVEATAGQQRLNNLLACVQLARGVALVSAGRQSEAYEQLLRLFDPADLSYHQRESFDGVMFFAEAAASSHHREEGRAVVAELESIAQVTTAPLLHVHLLYARAVLADEAGAEELYLRALATDLARWPLVRAKTELAYGSWLRRQRRAVEARIPLRAAQTTLDLIGAPAWAEQARAELRATGERVEPRRISAKDALSPQELQIARLAAQGLSNREIGERLYLSPRTISSHLYRIFPKLEITSRGQLASRLDTGNPDLS